MNAHPLSRRTAIRLLAGASVLCFGSVAPLRASGLTTQVIGIGRDQPFNDGWLFLKGDLRGAEHLDYPDAGWRIVDLPHDWSIEDLPMPSPPDRIGPFDKSAIGNTATGFTVGGEGWYRKHFSLQETAGDCRVEVAFDGIYMVSDLWLNGEKLGSHVHGYTPFSFNLTPFLRPDGNNVLAVRVRNLGRNTRFYSGSGIYRPVSITVLRTSSGIARWGVQAWTRRIADGRADIEIATRLDQVRDEMTLLTRLVGSDGKIVAEARSEAKADTRQQLIITSPRLWSAERPELYQLHTALFDGGQMIDEATQPFGVRIVAFEVGRGMSVNGKQVKLRGGCLHHDNGLLGAATFADADERRVRLLKARGFNAVRSSHYPASASFRAACDRLGMYLIEEAFDMWHVAKEPDDYAQYFPTRWSDDLDAMVLSARNSPSVIMWSIGNEILGRSTQQGMEWAWKLGNRVHEMDPTRPVTAAINCFPGRLHTVGAATARPGRAGMEEEAAALFLDVHGYNYRLRDIKRDINRFPKRLMYASETQPDDAFDCWEVIESAPNVIGEFVWTAMDYIGEAGIGTATRVPASPKPIAPPAGYPWVNAFCGDIDLIGNQKPQSHFRDVLWGISALEIAVQRPLAEGMVEIVSGWGWPDELRSWTWPGSEGKELKVRVYSAADRVELRCNGHVIAGIAKQGENRLVHEFRVAYAPGRLEAVAYRGLREIGRQLVETTGIPSAIRVEPVGMPLRADRQTLAFVPITVVDASGRPLAEGDHMIDLAVSGPAELIAFGSGNPRATRSLQASRSTTWHGRALAILRSTGLPGVVHLTARAGMLSPARQSIQFS